LVAEGDNPKVSAACSVVEIWIMLAIGAVLAPDFSSIGTAAAGRDLAEWRSPFAWRRAGLDLVVYLC